MSDAPARLLIGPVLRRVTGDRATIWVETSAPGTVTVQAGPAGGSASTFAAFGHHYALVVVAGLPAGTATPYRVCLDGAEVWPLADSPFPPSVIRTPAPGGAGAVRLVFGSCREATPQVTGRRLPPDALDAYARRLAGTDGAGAGAGTAWPDLLVLLGDQVYADETSPRIRRQLRRRRRADPADRPVDQVVSYDEYTQLYLESWLDPEIRWLLSTVPSVMIFDDHEIIDDWNSSAAWRADIARQPWWRERISSGLASYWVYQHLGNLHPDELADDPVYAAVTGAADATDVLRDFGLRADAALDDLSDDDRPGRRYRWSYALDVGPARLVMLDNRGCRVLGGARRAMLPDSEWRWFLGQARGGHRHLVVGSSLPWLMPPAIHHLEAWNERLAASPRPAVARLAEWLRRVFDLEHWAAFQDSFRQLAEVFAELGSAADPPASINVLSGDVHHSYVARARYDPSVRTPVHQLTCSPIHNEVPAAMRPLMRLGWGRTTARLGRAVARSAGLPRPPLRWRRLSGPFFGNAVSTLTLDETSAHVLIEGTTGDSDLAGVGALWLSPAGPDAGRAAGPRSERNRTGAFGPAGRIGRRDE